MGSSKAKGSAGERRIAKMLTKWASGQEEEYWYWRSSNSGGTNTVSGRLNPRMSGDIVAIHPDGLFLTDRFSIEIKTGYPNALIDKHLGQTKTDEIKGFWRQAGADADTREPILILHRTRSTPWIGITAYTATCLDIYTLDCPIITMQWPAKDNLPVMVVLPLTDFLTCISPATIRQLEVPPTP